MKPISLLSSVLVALASVAVRAADAPKLNVLLIYSDDMRAEPATFGGRAITPNLDKLAKQGVRFDRAYCQYPLCNPSRISTLTGRQPATTQLYGNRDWFNAVYPDWVSLPKYFKQHGYVTLRTGKIFHGGIDDTDAWTEGGEPRRLADPGPKKRAEPSRVSTTAAEEDARIAQLAKQDRSRAAQSDRWEAVENDTEPTGDAAVANRAIDYLRKRKESAQPFFLACGFSKPHSPLVAPKRFFDLYRLEDIALPPDFAPRPAVPPGFPVGSIRRINADLFIGREATKEQAREMIRAYYACVSYADWNVGRVLAELEALGLRESTLIVFMGDHGYQLGEKGKWSKAGSLWEQGARVPLIVHLPRARGNGTASPRIVQLVDIYATLADLCALPPPQGIEGVSLRPLLDDPLARWEHPAFTVWSERGRWMSGIAVRTERWRYAEFYGLGAGAMLTDPTADPHELKNLAHDPKYAGVVAELSALVKRYGAGKTEPAEPAAP